MNYAGLIFIAIGLFSLMASIKEWSWFFNNRKAKNLAKLISYKGSRIFYGLIGTALIAIGSLVFINIIYL